jgi:TonB-linked SusC/RagA family outer membrane protein
MFALLASPVAARSAAAQEGVLAGTVVAAGTQRPIAGAQVTVQGQAGKGAVTDAQGRFRIAGVTGTDVVVQARMIGFQSATQTARVGAMELRLAMSEVPFSLEQVVVTGTAAGAERLRQIGNSVATVKAAEVVEVAPVRNVQQLLQGRVPGVFVAPASGMVGSGERMRVRGQTTFSLPSDPLIYVDGARVNNEAATGITVQGFSSGVVSRMNDINPEDIETIEVVKGPAASTLYGTEASRGVINIITKRGSVGTTTYGLTVRQGAQWWHDVENQLPVNYWKDPSGKIQSLNIYALEKQRGNEIFRTGQTQGYTGSVSGGNAAARYFVSGDIDDDEGIDPTNGRRQFSGRANVQMTPLEKFDLNVSTGYVSNATRLACEAGCGGRMWSTLYSTPALLAENACTPTSSESCGYSRGFQGWTPEAYDIWNVTQDLHRFTASLTANWRPFPWMAHRATVGRDVTEEYNQELLPYLTSDTLRYFWGSRFSNGYRYQTRREVVFDTYDYSGSLNFDLPRAFKSTTSLGLQYYIKSFDNAAVQGEGFPTPDVSTVAAAANKTFQTQDYSDNRTLGAFLQQQIGWRDRLFVTGAVRVDNNSAFGADVDFVVYPKAQVSWVVNEEPFFQRNGPSWFNTLRLRGAFGESGQQPDIFAALRTFRPIAGPGGTAAITPQAVGNPNLRPERGREIELGFDAAFVNDRFGLDFTYYHTQTREAILLQDVPPSGGFPDARWTNVGQILNQGIESVIRANVLNVRQFGWDLSMNLSTNKGEVQELNGRDTTIVVGSVQHRIGYPAASWFRERVVSATFDPVSGRAVNAMCDNGAGGTTPCFNAQGTVIAPRVYLGRTTPNFEGSLTSTFRIMQNARVHAMIDRKSGFAKWDNNLRIRCQIFYTCLEYIDPVGQKTNPKDLAQMQTSGTLVDFVVNDASFTRLREIALNVDVPERYTRRLIGARALGVNLAARNLKTWTNYTGLDPEVMFQGGTLAFQFEQDQIPHPRQFVATLNLRF